MRLTLASSLTLGKKMTKKNEIELDIMSSGEIRFCRCDPESNEELLSILAQMVDGDQVKELEEFFSGAEDIEHILGNEPLCG